MSVSTEEVFEKIKPFLKKCPICKTESFQNEKDTIKIKGVDESVRYDNAQVVCNNCGYVMLFNKKMATKIFEDNAEPRLYRQLKEYFK